jgi:hypothetical protein
MNDYEKTIEVLQNRVSALEQLIQPVVGVRKWQPKGGNFFIQSNGKVSEVVGGSDTLHKVFGVERPARQQAERACIEMRKFNRLLALRDELSGDDVPTLESSNIPKCFIVYNGFEDTWEVSAIYKGLVTPCFKTEKQARRACDMLNSGEVEL